MIELAPDLVRSTAIVIDSDAARHEAGDLIHAGIDTRICATLEQIVTGRAVQRALAPLLFKSCGSALWDLAAARLLATHQLQA